jgi:hypothetical protein
MKTLLFILSIFTTNLIWASAAHLDFGGGAHGSSYRTEGRSRIFAPGLNFKTDLGYEFVSNVSAEWSSQVKFSDVDDVIAWETLMTIGLRFDFPTSPYFMRVFWGRSPTVYYRGGVPQLSREAQPSRLQFEGPVAGVSVGKKFSTPAGRNWFIETGVSHQRLEEVTGVNNDGAIIVEAFNRDVPNHIHILTLYAMVGLRIF